MKDFFSRLFGFKAVQQTSPLAYEFGSQVEKLIEFGIDGTHVNSAKAFSLYRKSSVVATSVEIIAKKLSSIMPVMSIDGELTDDHPVIDFLLKPNDYEMWRTFIGDMARHRLIDGNNYMVSFGNINNEPLEIYNINPQDIHPFSTVSDGLPESYQVSGLLAMGMFTRQPRPGGGIRFVANQFQEIYHCKDFATRSTDLVGDSPLQSIIEEVGQYIDGILHNRGLLKNGGRLSLLFMIKDYLSEEGFQEAKAKIQKTFSGSANAGKIGVLAAKEAEVQEFGTTNKDMEYQAIIELTKTAVFARYQIPLPLVLATRQTYDNYGEAIDALYHDAVLPLYDSLAEGISDFILPRFGLDPRRVRVTYDPQSIPALREKMLEELERQVKLEAMTVNEIRDQLPRLESVDGGDVVLGSATKVPIAGQNVDPASFLIEDREASEEMRQAALQSENEGENNDD